MRWGIGRGNVLNGAEGGELCERGKTAFWGKGEGPPHPVAFLVEGGGGCRHTHCSQQQQQQLGGHKGHSFNPTPPNKHTNWGQSAPHPSGGRKGQRAERTEGQRPYCSFEGGLGRGRVCPALLLLVATGNDGAGGSPFPQQTAFPQRPIKLGCAVEDDEDDEN